MNYNPLGLNYTGVVKDIHSSDLIPPSTIMTAQECIHWVAEDYFHNVRMLQIAVLLMFLAMLIVAFLVVKTIRNERAELPSNPHKEIPQESSEEADDHS